MPPRGIVASDSEPERVSPKKPSSKMPDPADDGEPPAGDEAEDDEEGDGEEYEIEAILDAKANAFPAVCIQFSTK